MNVRMTHKRALQLGLWLGGGMLGLALVASGCTLRGHSWPTPTPWPTSIVSEKPEYVVQRGTVVDRFQLNGNVVPVERESIYFPVDGRLSALKVTEGSLVQRGDVLAELEMTALLDQLAQARLSLEQAQDQWTQQSNTLAYELERARLNLQMQEIKLEALRDAQEGAAERGTLQKVQAEKELERYRLGLERAQAAYDQVKDRPDVGTTPQAAALQSATVDYELAQARYRLATLPAADDGQVALAEVQVELARLAVEELEEQTDPTLERDIAKAQIAIQGLERQVAERQLLAPFDGQVISAGLNAGGVRGTVIMPRVGEAIPAFTPLVVVAKPERLEVVISATEDRANELVVGQTVTLTHYLAQDRPFTAHVVSLPVAHLLEGERPKPPQVVRVALPDDTADLPPMSIGDYVDVDVVLAVHQDALFLPPSAVRDFAGRRFVVIRVGDQQRRVDFTAGIENPTQIEILSGLNEGDLVVGP